MEDRKNSVLKALKKWEYLRNYEEFKEIDREMKKSLGHQRICGTKNYAGIRGKDNGRQGIGGSESRN